MADIHAYQRPGEIRITRSDVGRRVMVRKILEIVDNRPTFADTLGVLTSWDDGVLTVVRRDGEAVGIAERLLVAGKPVPPAPARRSPAPEADPVELQRIAARGWPAVETAALGDWTLRAAGGFTRRANSVQALGDPGLPLPAALDAVRDWYRARGLAALVEVTEPGSPAGLREDPDLLGTDEAPSRFCTAPLAPLARLAARADLVRLARTASPGWMARYPHRTDGGPAAKQAARAVLHGGPSVWFAAVPAPDGHGPAAIGRCVVDGAWAGFSAVEVEPEHRGRGLAGQVIAVLAARAAEEGATGGYLQVESDNSAAAALYDTLGFTTSHTYHYRRLPQG